MEGERGKGEGFFGGKEVALIRRGKKEVWGGRGVLRWVSGFFLVDGELNRRDAWGGGRGGE